jgi:hypothetical protein
MKTSYSSQDLRKIFDAFFDFTAIAAFMQVAGVGGPEGWMMWRKNSHEFTQVLNACYFNNDLHGDFANLIEARMALLRGEGLLSRADEIIGKAAAAVFEELLDYHGSIGCRERVLWAIFGENFEEVKQTPEYIAAKNEALGAMREYLRKLPLPGEIRGAVWKARDQEEDSPQVQRNMELITAYFNE